MADQTEWRYCQKCHAIFYDGYPSKGRCPEGGAHEAAGYNFALTYDLPETPTAQAAWRYCQKCQVMFFDGYPDKGKCPAGGHQAAGWTFVLPHDVPETATAQSNWRYCQKCHGMFYDDGNPNKGLCSAGGGHEAAGSTFVLPHHVSETETAQTNWRYCQKCHAIFFDGNPDKGSCPAGGGHEAAGWTFVLPHDVPETATAQAAWRYCGTCHVMFFDGYPDKGSCAASDHEAAGYNFVLAHDVPETVTSQAAWRYCDKCHVMFFDGYPDKGRCSAGGSHEAQGFNFVLPHDFRGSTAAQTDWRYCQKCHAIFFDGFPDKGSCPAGGGHESQGYNFAVPHDLAETKFAQTDWRYCQKCHAMFFDGYPDKGSCPVGGGHEAAGYRFVVPHDLPDAPTAQAAWRFCQKCHAMFFDGSPDKGKCPVGGSHEAAGYNFVLPHDLRPFVFTGNIVTGGLSGLGGNVKMTVNLDGSIRWEGAMHNSGAVGYDFGISALVRAPTGRAIAAVAHTGHVGGLIGSRDHGWDETYPASSDIALFLTDLPFGRLETYLEYEGDIGSKLESALGLLAKFAAGSLLTPLGAIFFVGAEIGSLISTGSLVPGARLVGGVLWMAGPGNTLFAISAEGIASLGSHTRELTPEEYDWANNEVFLGSLPPRDRLVLTDTIGAGNRPFAFPRFDGKITLNMGEAGFVDPRMFPGIPGRTFVHELVHACQIHHTKVDLTLLADALAAKVCELTEGRHVPYRYGPAGPPFSEFHLEPQAQIVADWFAGVVPEGSNQTGTAKDINSPYFRYINESLRTGNL